MDCDSEDAGYGESVARQEHLIETLRAELAETQALVLKLAECANYKRVKDPSSRELVETQVELIRQRYQERRGLACAQALATAKDRVRYTKRKIAEIQRLGGVPSQKLTSNLARQRKRVKLIRASDPMNTTLY